MSSGSRALWTVVAALLAGCAVETAGLGDLADGAAPDATPRIDAHVPTTDAGDDAGPRRDLDAGPPRDDDAGPPRDAGTDAGPPPPADAGPCPGDGDDDGDGACNSVDACPGSDDGEDEDGDGVPDGCDPCSLDGPSSPAIALPVTASGITIGGVELNGAARNVVVVDRGATVSVHFDYTVENCGCPGCREQIEVGLVPGGDHLYCAYDGVPGCTPDTSSSTRTITAPGTPGEYYLRFGRRLDYGCAYTHGTWWTGPPPAGRTFGAICVR